MTNKIILGGIQGLSGSQGERGEIGIGVAGPPGTQGQQGPKGDQGAHGVVDGSGSKGTIPVYVDSTVLADSQLHQYLTNGSTLIGVYTKLPRVPFHIAYTGAGTDDIFQVSSGPTNPFHMDLSATSIQTYSGLDDTTVAPLALNPAGGAIVLGADVILGPGTYQAITQLGKLFTTSADGVVITTPISTNTNFLLVAPDKTPILTNPAGTTNIAIVPTAGKVIIGVNTVPSGQQATVDIAGTLRSSVSVSTGKRIIDNGTLLTLGDAQVVEYVVRTITLNATQVELFTDGTATRVPLPLNSSNIYHIDIVARQIDGSNSMMSTLQGGIDVDGSGVATMREAGGTDLSQTDPTWDFAANTYTTGGNAFLQLSAIGSSGASPVHWVAYVRITSVI